MIIKRQGETVKIYIDEKKFIEDYKKLKKEFIKKASLARKEKETAIAKITMLKREFIENVQKLTFEKYLVIEGVSNIMIAGRSLSLTGQNTYFVWYKGFWRKVSNAMAILQKMLHRLQEKFATIYEKTTSMQYSQRKKIQKLANEIMFEISVRALLYKENFDVLEHWRNLFPQALPVFTKDAVYVVRKDKIEKIKTSKTFFNFFAIPHQAKDIPTPNFDKYLKQTFKDKQTIKTMWQILAYCITPIKLYPYFFFLHGEGGTGKTTFQRIVKAVVGHKNVCAIPLDSLNNTNIERLAFSLVNLASETKASVFNEDLIKAVSDQMIVECNPKYRDPYTILPIASHIFAMNKLPPVSDLSQGFWRRCRVIPFRNVISNPDPFIVDKIKAEIPGILFKAINELQKIIRNGGQIQFSQEIERETLRYREETTSIVQFLKDFEEFFEITLEKLKPLRIEEITNNIFSVYLSKKDFYANYSQWALTQGFKTMSSTEFYTRLKMINVADFCEKIREIKTTRIKVNGKTVRVAVITYFKEPEQVTLLPEVTGGGPKPFFLSPDSHLNPFPTPPVTSGDFVTSSETRIISSIEKKENTTEGKKVVKGDQSTQFFPSVVEVFDFNPQEDRDNGGSQRQNQGAVPAVCYSCKHYNKLTQQCQLGDKPLKKSPGSKACWAFEPND